MLPFPSRKGLGQREKRSSDYIPSDISNSPNGEAKTPKNGYSALRELEAVGSRLKNSRSLQSLETATMDRVRSVAERTGGLGSNIRMRYGSQVDLAFGKYQHLEEGGSPGLRWR